MCVPRGQCQLLNIILVCRIISVCVLVVVCLKREQFVYRLHTDKLYWHLSVCEALFMSHHSTYRTVVH